MDAEKRDHINQAVISHLKEYISEVSPYLEEFFQKQRINAAKISPIAEDMVARFEDFIGGKRLRGSLTKLGYEIFGGKPTNDIYKASAIIEIIHGFGLMHDDIMDEDELRRKKPTMHIQYENLHADKYSDSKRDQKLFGTSMALNVGDLGPFYANLIIEDTDFAPEIKMGFLKRLSEIVIQTVHGQGLDVSSEQDNKPDEDTVMDIHKFKTAFYTISGPLQYGAILAGADTSDPRYQALEEFGIPVGIAFQLRDDELGMFSKSEKFGKPIYSDLRQGKNTVLFAKAFENASAEQLEILEAAHGNPDVTEEDLQKVNQILEDTGAVEYSQEISWDLVAQGKEHVSQITDNPEHKEMLDLVADFVVSRDK